MLPEKYCNKSETKCNTDKWPVLKKQCTRSHKKLSHMKSRLLYEGTNTIFFHVVRACYLGLHSFCGELETDSSSGGQKKKRGWGTKRQMHVENSFSIKIGNMSNIAWATACLEYHTQFWIPLFKKKKSELQELQREPTDITKSLFIKEKLIFPIQLSKIGMKIKIKIH